MHETQAAQKECKAEHESKQATTVVPDTQVEATGRVLRNRQNIKKPNLFADEEEVTKYYGPNWEATDDYH